MKHEDLFTSEQTLLGYNNNPKSPYKWTDKQKKLLQLLSEVYWELVNLLNSEQGAQERDATEAK